ncbi:MAG: hypothetical protein WCT31_01180 [Candidatus Micrarchaeia archaeon]
MKKLFVLMAFAILFGNLFAVLSLPSYSVTPSSVSPGGSGVISLTVSNPVSTTATNEKIYGVALSLYPDSAITTSERVSIGDLDSGASSVISIPFYTKLDAKSGVYVVEIRAIGSGGTYVQTTTIPITISNAPILSVSSNKDVVKDIEPISVTVANNGGVAKRVRLSINSTIFAISGQNEVYMDEIIGDAVFNITLDSRSATEGANDVPFVLRYQDELGNQITENKNVRMTVKKEKLDLGFAQQSEVITMKDSILKFSITNSGKEIDDVRVSPSTDSIRLKDASEFKLGDLLPGQRIDVSLPVFATASPGINYISFDVKYVEQGVEKEQTLSIPITITSDADVSVYLDAKPSPLAIGQEHTISVLVSNLGSYEISSVDVAIASPALTSLDIQDKAYIGGLNKDDFSTVQFKVKVKDVKPGDYPINVVVNYRDKSGEWKQKILPVDVSINEPVVQGNGTALYVIVALFIVLVLVWYFKFRVKKQASN